jgi:hypothetical protein
MNDSEAREPVDQPISRADHLLMLEFGNRAEFKGQISLGAAVVAPGLTVLAVILFMGAVSGAHLNPAVSLAFALRGDFPWLRVPGYIIVQLLGATLACLFLLAVFGNIEHLGAALPGPGYANWQALRRRAPAPSALPTTTPRGHVPARPRGPVSHA